MEYGLNDILTVEELMELLNIGKNTAYSLLDSGEIKAFRIGRISSAFVSRILHIIRHIKVKTVKEINCIHQYIL